MYFSQATVPFDSVFDRAIKLRDCTLVGFRQKAFQTGEHTFKMIVNGVENHATSTCGKSHVRTKIVRIRFSTPSLLWHSADAHADAHPVREGVPPKPTTLDRCRHNCCLAGHDASDHCQIIRAWKPRLKSWICCWLKRRCQWWRRDRNELRCQKDDTNGVKREWWVIFLFGLQQIRSCMELYSLKRSLCHPTVHQWHIATLP